MNRRKGVLILIFLVLLLGVVNAAWIFSYKKTVIADIIGREQKIYTISQDFSDLLLNTSNGLDNKSTLMKINNLKENMNMLFKIETRVTNLSSCPDYDKDCKVTVTQIFNNGTRNILSDTDHYYINEEANLTLFKDAENVLEYNIVCVKNSCPQRIKSNITLSQI